MHEDENRGAQSFLELFGVLDESRSLVERHGGVEACREALEWVSENGGLDNVRDCHRWMVSHCATADQMDFDWWLSFHVMNVLGFDEYVADRGEVESKLDARLMPEGYEWPRFDEGKLLRYGDAYAHDGAERKVWHIDFDSDGDACILNLDGSKTHLKKGERVKRPAPKVLDADGVEIRVGDTLYYVDGCEQKVNTVARLTNGLVQFGRINEAGYVTYCEAACIPPDQLTHRAPVLAADGKPLRVGKTVYEVNTGKAFVVEGIYSGTTEPDFPEHTVRCHKLGDITAHMFEPSQLTHEQPDTWERIEADAAALVGKTSYMDASDEDALEAIDEVMGIVKRCKALAEREA